MFDKTTIAIICIALLGITGLLKGLDGALLVSTISGIAALVGVQIGKSIPPK